MQSFENTAGHFNVVVFHKQFWFRCVNIFYFFPSLHDPMELDGFKFYYEKVKEVCKFENTRMIGTPLVKLKQQQQQHSNK